MKLRHFFKSYENITQAKIKKIKRPLSKSSSESKHETDENYQFIVLESVEETPITKLSSFLIQKTIESHCKPINIKVNKFKLQSGYLSVTLGKSMNPFITGGVLVK